MKQLTFLSLTYFIIVSSVIGQVPQELSYQGLLTDANGNHMNGDFDLTFRLYTAPAGGSSVWEENQNVTVSGGIFNVILGSLNALNLPFDQTYWLGITMNDGSELEPRIQLTASAYSLHARSIADHAVGTAKIQDGAITQQKLALGVSLPPSGQASGDLTGTYPNPTIAENAVTGSKLSNSALKAGSNVTITRQNDGTLEIAATGGDGGLLSVASDATLAGDGTSENPLHLADEAVTGKKLADSALMAGQNVTLSRQQDGSIEIESAGLSLPFSGSTGSSDAAFSVENTGGGDGIHITGAGGNGLSIDQATDDGVLVDQATYDGVAINQAGRFGLNVANSARGVNINNATAHGLVVGKAGAYGLYVLDAGQDGVVVQHAGNPSTTEAAGNRNNGVEVQGAESDGVFVGRADQIGINIQSSGINGIQVGTTGFDGIQIQSAGRDGVRVSSATDYGINASGTKGAGRFNGNVAVTGDLTAQNIAINSQAYLATRLSVQGNAAVSGKLVVTEGSPGATFASNIIEVDQNSATDPIADAWTVYSSRRWKENIRTMDNAVEKVTQLRGVTYDWKATGKHDIGLIAEEVGEVFPEIVAFEQNGEDAKSLDYARLVSVLIEAIKEQQIMIDKVNGRLNALLSASQ